MKPLHDTHCNAENLPANIKGSSCFCCWKYETQDGRMTKAPINPMTGNYAKANDPATFGPLELAAREQQKFDGVAIGLFENIGAIDIDHCIQDDPDGTPTITDMAKDIINTMHSYWEFSPSGTGVRILFTVPDGYQYDRTKYYIHAQEIGLEVYLPGMTNKTVTLTGHTLFPGYMIQECSAQLPQILEKYMRRPVKESPKLPAPQYTNSEPLSDQEVLDAIEKNRDRKAISLLNGDISGYKSHSEADSALCTKLFFWTSGNMDQTERLFIQSGLYRESKGKNYVRNTIVNAYNACYDGGGYTPPRSKSDRKQHDYLPSTDSSHLIGYDGEPLPEGLTPDEIEEYYNRQAIELNIEPFKPKAAETPAEAPQGAQSAENPSVGKETPAGQTGAQTAAETARETIQANADADAEAKAQRERIQENAKRADFMARLKQDSVKDYLNSDRVNVDIEKFKRNVMTGYSNIDENTGGLYSGLYVVAATPSAGKTTFCWQMCDQLAAAGHSVLYFSLEQSRLEMVTKSITRITAQRNPKTKTTSLDIRKGKWKDPIEPAIREYLETAADRVHVVESNFSCTSEEIKNYITQYIECTGIRPIVILDYLQIITPQEKNGRSQTTKEAIDTVITDLKRLSRDENLTVIAICSVNRGAYLSPIDFESLKESGNIEFTADVIWGLQLHIMTDDPKTFDGSDKNKVDKRKQVKEANEEQPRKVDLVCLKNRFGKKDALYRFNYYSEFDLFVPITDPQTAHNPSKAGRTLGK